jgi:hypothetical protein
MYLDYFFVPVIFFQMPLESLALIQKYTFDPPLASKTDPKKTSDFTILLEKHVENPATVALDIAADIGHLLLILPCLLNFAELRVIQGRKEDALAYWTECVDVTRHFFFPEGGFVGLCEYPITRLRYFLNLFRRLTRCGLALSVICDHLDILEAFLALEKSYCVRMKEGFIAGRPDPIVSAHPIATSTVTKPIMSEPAGGKGYFATIDAIKVDSPTLGIERGSPIDHAVTSRVGTSRARRDRNTLTTSPDDRKSTLTHSSTPTRGSVFDLWSVTQSQSIDVSMERSAAEYEALSVWSLLHIVKRHLKKYSNGKATQADTFQIITRVAQRARPITSKEKKNPFRAMAKSKDKKETDKGRVRNIHSFSEYVNLYPNLKSFLYLLHLDEGVILFTPTTNKYVTFKIREEKMMSDLNTGGDTEGSHSRRIFRRESSIREFFRIAITDQKSELFCVVSMSQTCSTLTLFTALFSNGEKERDDVLIAAHSPQFFSSFRRKFRHGPSTPRPHSEQSDHSLVENSVSSSLSGSSNTNSFPHTRSSPSPMPPSSDIIHRTPSDPTQIRPFRVISRHPSTFEFTVPNTKFTYPFLSFLPRDALCRSTMGTPIELEICEYISKNEKRTGIDMPLSRPFLS